VSGLLCPPPESYLPGSDLPRPLQQMLFDIAESLTGPAHPRPADLTSLTTPAYRVRNQGYSLKMLPGT
jgi:hypothetical protein